MASYNIHGMKTDEYKSIPKTKKVAYCNSVKCVGNTVRYIKKEPKEGSDYCPDCNTYVRWKRVAC